MALRRLLALAVAATVAADVLQAAAATVDVVQVAVLCDSRTAAGRAECDMATLRVRGELKRKRKLEKTNTLMVQNQVRAAIESVDHFSAPFQLVRASALYACSKLPLHETLRSEGELVAVDRIEDVAENYSLASTGGARAIVFFSHQWLGNDDCDPM